MPPHKRKRLTPMARRNHIAMDCIRDQFRRGISPNKRGLQLDEESMPGYAILPDPNEVCYCWNLVRYQNNAWDRRN